jgi:D-alanyl-lipoteichoic acid acyltransferase DltB (MBOAT superfamily)
MNLLNFLSYDSSNPVLFNSGFFIWFFFIFIVFYSLASKFRLPKVFVIIVFSYYFYYRASGWFIALLFLTTFFDYVLAGLIYSSNTKYLKKIFLLFSLLINIGLLVYFKYANFFVNLYGDLSGSDILLLNIVVPFGISFYTFQKLGYVLDVYKDTVKPYSSFAEFTAFVSFFPVIGAGPILRARNFIPQLQEIPETGNFEISRAVFLISAGLIKKGIISDYIGVNFVDRIFENPSLYTGFENLSAVYAYAIQIYCDFSGYSDIAIGIALLMGFKIPDNFNSPYKAKGISDFWKRWHISLSLWFRDYLFLPVAYKILRILKNKKFLGVKPENWSYYFSTFVTMTLCGFWHGANLTFIFWGIYHAIGLSFERVFNSVFKFKSYFLSKSLNWFFTLHFILLGWLFFRAESFDKAIEILKIITGSLNYAGIGEIISGYKEVYIIILAGYLLHFIPKKVEDLYRNFLLKLPLIAKVAFLVLVIWLIIQVKTSQIQPFIYFSF